nr:unnamed protein product [Haemonchus contortus]
MEAAQGQGQGQGQGPVQGVKRETGNSTTGGNPGTRMGGSTIEGSTGSDEAALPAEKAGIGRTIRANVEDTEARTRTHIKHLAPGSQC